MSALVLHKVVRRVRAYCHLEDADALLFALAVGAASRCDGDPLWGLIVGSPSGGKTETIRVVEAIADEHLDDITAAGLLSWTKGKNPRRTGLLTRVPARALATIGDLSSLLAGSDRGQREEVYALLRRVYDGEVTREVGQQAPLKWQGKLALLGAATQDVDRYASHDDALGARWLYLRIADLTPEARAQAIKTARAHAMGKADLRRAAQEAAREVYDAAVLRLPGVELSESAGETIDRAATVAALGRASVPRSGYGSRDVVGEAVREEPVRLAGQLATLCMGLLAIGLEERDALRLVERAALDSMPLTRRKVLAQLATGEPLSVSEISRRVGTDRKVVRFALEDLRVVGVCEGEGEDEPARGSRIAWRLCGPEAQLVAGVFVARQSWDEKWIYPHTTPQEEGEKRGDNPHFVPTQHQRENGHPNGSEPVDYDREPRRPTDLAARQVALLEVAQRMRGESTR